MAKHREQIINNFKNIISQMSLSRMDYIDSFFIKSIHPYPIEYQCNEYDGDSNEYDNSLINRRNFD